MYENVTEHQFRIINKPSYVEVINIGVYWVYQNIAGIVKSRKCMGGEEENLY
jgi:hypothetical protein